MFLVRYSIFQRSPIFYLLLLAFAKKLKTKNSKFKTHNAYFILCVLYHRVGYLSSALTSPVLATGPALVEEKSTSKADHAKQAVSVLYRSYVIA